MENVAKKPLLVVLLGPTGVGKTNLSLEIAELLGCDILSCDSRQMYRELKIGTAAPTIEQLNRVKHHFIGNLSIHNYYNVSQFEIEALALLKELYLHKPVALMTGGSGLYIDTLVNGIDDLPNIDMAIRQALMAQFEHEGIESLQAELQIVDPQYYASADIKNPKRLLKALEVYRMTGMPYSALLTNVPRARPFKPLLIGINRPRAELYQRIDQRVDIMLQQGLEDEARQFYPYKHLNSLNTVGYKELFGYFDGQYDFEEAIRLIKRNSRHYAKRQLTYWNRNKNITWFGADEPNNVIDFIKNELYLC
jgi:tRNA dimethylallyltransferase